MNGLAFCIFIFIIIDIEIDIVIVIIIYCLNNVYIPRSQVWNPCISDVRSIRDKNTVPRIIPFKMRMTQANNPVIMLKKKKK